MNAIRVMFKAIVSALNKDRLSLKAGYNDYLSLFNREQ